MTDSIDHNPTRGWLLYDGECPTCTDLATRFQSTLEGRRFGLAPLQTPWVRAQLGLDSEAPLTEMKVLTHEGKVLGGADAIVYLARKVWWASPLLVVARMPLGMRVLRRAYRWVAARRLCLPGACVRCKPARAPASWPGCERGCNR